MWFFFKKIVSTQVNDLDSMNTIICKDGHIRAQELVQVVQKISGDWIADLKKKHVVGLKSLVMSEDYFPEDDGTLYIKLPKYEIEKKVTIKTIESEAEGKLMIDLQDGSRIELNLTSGEPVSGWLIDQQQKYPLTKEDLQQCVFDIPNATYLKEYHPGAYFLMIAENRGTHSQFVVGTTYYGQSMVKLKINHDLKRGESVEIVDDTLRQWITETLKIQIQQWDLSYQEIQDILEKIKQKLGIQERDLARLQLDHLKSHKHANSKANNGLNKFLDFLNVVIFSVEASQNPLIFFTAAYTLDSIPYKVTYADLLKSVSSKHISSNEIEHFCDNYALTESAESHTKEEFLTAFQDQVINFFANCYKTETFIPFEMENFEELTDYSYHAPNGTESTLIGIQVFAGALYDQRLKQYQKELEQDKEKIIDQLINIAERDLKSGVLDKKNETSLPENHVERCTEILRVVYQDRLISSFKQFNLEDQARLYQGVASSFPEMQELAQKELIAFANQQLEDYFPENFTHLFSTFLKEPLQKKLREWMSVLDMPKQSIQNFGAAQKPDNQTRDLFSSLLNLKTTIEEFKNSEEFKKHILQGVALLAVDSQKLENNTWVKQYVKSIQSDLEKELQLGKMDSDNWFSHVLKYCHQKNWLTKSKIEEAKGIFSQIAGQIEGNITPKLTTQNLSDVSSKETDQAKEKLKVLNSPPKVNPSLADKGVRESQVQDWLEEIKNNGTPASGYGNCVINGSRYMIGEYKKGSDNRFFVGYCGQKKEYVPLFVTGTMDGAIMSHPPEGQVSRKYCEKLKSYLKSKQENNLIESFTL